MHTKVLQQPRKSTRRHKRSVMNHITRSHSLFSEEGLRSGRSPEAKASLDTLNDYRRFQKCRTAYFKN